MDEHTFNYYSLRIRSLEMELEIDRPIELDSLNLEQLQHLLDDLNEIYSARFGVV